VVRSAAGSVISSRAAAAAAKAQLSTHRRPARLGEVVGGDCAEIAVGHRLDVPTLTLTQDRRADELLGRDPLALLLGMLFDQHVRQRCSEVVAVAARPYAPTSGLTPSERRSPQPARVGRMRRDRMRRE
jgi:hypothetical protein